MSAAFRYASDGIKDHKTCFPCIKTQKLYIYIDTVVFYTHRSKKGQDHAAD